MSGKCLYCCYLTMKGVGVGVCMHAHVLSVVKVKTTGN